MSIKRGPKPGSPKHGGRKKGTPNRDRAPVIQKARELGIDPFEVLLLFAAGDWQRLGYEAEKIIKYSKDVQNEEYTIDPAVRMKAAAEACQYLYPKRKAIQFEDKTKKTKTGFEKFSDQELAEIAKKEFKDCD